MSAPGKDVCFVDAGLEVFVCPDEVYLVVNQHLRGVPGRCSRQLVGVDSVGKDESVALANCMSLHPLSFVCRTVNLPTVPAQCWHASGPTVVLQSP